MSKFDLQKETAKLYGYDEKISNASGPTAANLIKDVLKLETSLDSAGRAQLDRAIEFLENSNWFGASGEVRNVIYSSHISPEAESRLTSALRLLETDHRPSFSLEKEQTKLWEAKQ